MLLGSVLEPHLGSVILSEPECYNVSQKAIILSKTMSDLCLLFPAACFLPGWKDTKKARVPAVAVA